MKRRTLKVRWLVTVFMLLSVMALSLPAIAVTPVVIDSCAVCEQQCADESVQMMNQCIAGGSAWQSCYHESIVYYNNCKRFFCRYGGMCS